MPEHKHQPQPQHSGFNVNDLLFILFRHKWKVLLCAVAGICAAAVFYFLNTRVYQSDAKLLVRYVLERSAVDSIDNTSGAGAKNAATTSDAIINAEVEILNSWDLATQVADVVGVQRLLPKAG